MLTGDHTLPRRARLRNLSVKGFALKRSEIQAKLKEFGTPIGAEYDQTNGTSHPKLVDRVGAGMCGGVTVDWIRRVLTGGKGADSGNPFPAHGSNPEKSLRQYSKAAALQILSSKASQDAFYAEYSKKLKAAFDSKRDAVNAAIMKAGHTFTDQDEYDAYVAKVKAAFETWTKEKYDPLKTTEAKFQKFWEHYCKTMASKIGRNPDHRLSNLSIVSSSSTRIYTGGLKEFFVAVLKAIGPNEAANVGVSPPVKDLPGHAIGIRRLDKSKDYHFFDPNFGVYSMDLRSLFESLLFLFGEGYPKAEDEKGDFHVYEVNGKVGGDYVVFRKRLAA